MGDDEDLMVQEETQNFKCPYTGQEMVEPVKNTACGHTYDKEGILVYIKQRGKRAKYVYIVCLVGLCMFYDLALHVMVASTPRAVIPANTG